MKTQYKSHIGLAVGGMLMLAGATGCLGDSDNKADSGIHNDATTQADTGGTPDMGGDLPDTGETGDTGVQEDSGVTEQFLRLNFCIDDSANGTYTMADGLAWKGSMSYDAATNVITKNAGWTGPFPALYDDGPYTSGGHEPATATAGDHIWCIAAKFAVPTEDVAFEYGAISGSVNGSDGNWIWSGPNGSFTVMANQTTDINATPLVLGAFGTIDLRLTIDTANLHPDFAGFDPANGITVKSGAWGWIEIPITDDGMNGDVTANDGFFTFVLSEHTGAGTPLPHAGLMKAGDEAQFVFVLGGVEYKSAGTPPVDGIKAFVNAGGGWIEVPITNKPDGDHNTFITVPADLFAPPPNSVEVSFSIDDSANQTYAQGDGLAWKGSFGFNAKTRVLSRDASWGGPFAVLYDDGAWTSGGHEASNATAGDHIWTIATWVAIPAQDTMFEYGAIRGSVNGSDGDWIWQGPNGTFTVPANAMNPVRTVGLVLAAFGTTDFQLTLDTMMLDPAFAGFDPSTGVEVKSSGWGWTELMILDDGMNGDATAMDGIFTFRLSNFVGPGRALPHSGLLRTGDEPEFVFVLGGIEYKVAAVPSSAGVTASVMPMGGMWTTVPIMNRPAGDQNTYITVP